MKLGLGKRKKKTTRDKTFSLFQAHMGEKAYGELARDHLARDRIVEY